MKSRASPWQEKGTETQHARILTTCILESVYCGGHNPDTSEEAAARFLVDLAAIPDADGDAVPLAHVPAGEEEEVMASVCATGCLGAPFGLTPKG